MKFRFWLEFLLSLSFLSLLFAVALTAISYGSVADIPIAFGLIFSSFLIIGGFFEVILRLFPPEKDTIDFCSESAGNSSADGKAIGGL